MAIEISAINFWNRLGKLYSQWKSERQRDESPFASLDALSVVIGGVDEDAVTTPTSEMLFVHLLGFPFTDTVLVLTKDKVFAFCSAKKVKLLTPVMEARSKMADSNHLPELVLLDKPKNDEDKIKETIETILTEARGSYAGKSFGCLNKESPKGAFAQMWKDAVDAKTDLVQQEMELAVYKILAFQDNGEHFLMKDAANVAVKAMRKTFLREMKSVVVEETKVKQSAMAERIEKAIRDNAAVECDSSYFPTIQSGGAYNLAPGAETSDDELAYDTILCSFGVSCKEYNTHIARTYILDPTKSQRAAYKLLLQVHEEVISFVRPGAALSTVYSKALGMVKAKNPELAPYFLKNVGWAIGLPFRNKRFVIKGKSNEVVRSKMSFTVCVGFHNIELTDEEKEQKPSLKGGKYSLLLADTVYVDVEDNVVLTSRASKEVNRVVFDITSGDDDEEAEEKPRNEEVEIDLSNVIDDVPTVGRATRSSRKPKEQAEREHESKSQDYKIALHQQELMRKKALDAENRAHRVVGEEEEETVEIAEAYKSSKAFPKDLERNRILCDPTHESVLVPVDGCHVPFHISSIKSVSKNDEEKKASFLRLNFYYPTAQGSFARDTPLETREAMTRFNQHMYIKEMSFRSRDARNLNQQLRLIKELQKRVRARQRKAEEEADLVEQADLILSTDNKYRPQLDDVNMRPAFRKGKCIGRLTAHVNGFRFKTNRGEKVDIIYSNIKHFFFQPCKNELIVLIHFNLKHPIMIDRTKSYDVQFFTEVVEGSTALDGRRRSDYDPDEIDEENRERQLKKKLNGFFHKFCQQVIRVCDKYNQKIGPNNDVDIPYRKLGFRGVPHKDMILMQPTLYCLVNLTEMPFFVLSLDDVEHIHFERVDFRTLKNFDMVVIKKEHMEPNTTSIPARIQLIAMQDLDNIKNWIDEKGDLTFTYGIQSLNWKMVMKGVHNELERGIFWKDEDEDGEKKDVGWNFLSMVGDDEDDEEGESEESDYQEDSESDEEEEEDESDFDVSEEGEESDYGDESEEDAPSWDELHARAARADREKNFDVDADDRKAKKSSKKKKKHR